MTAVEHPIASMLVAFVIGAPVVVLTGAAWIGAVVGIGAGLPLLAWVLERDQSVGDVFDSRAPEWADRNGSRVYYVATPGIARITAWADVLPDRHWRRFADLGVGVMVVLLACWVILVPLAMLTLFGGVLHDILGFIVSGELPSVFAEMGGPPPEGSSSEATVSARTALVGLGGVVGIMVLGMWGLFLVFLPLSVPHELSHAIAAIKQGHTLEGYGIICSYAVIPVGAFVRVEMDDATTEEQVRVYAAGIMADLVVTTACLSVALIAFLVDPLAVSVVPIDGVPWTSISGVQLLGIGALLAV